MTENPMDTLRALIQRLSDETADIGLELHHAAFMPNPDGEGPDVMQAVFAIMPKKEAEAAPDEEQAKFDAAFEAMMAGEAQAEEKVETQDKIKDIESWLEGN